MLEIAQDASAIKRRDIATHRRAPRKFGFCRECGVRFQAHRPSREFCCTKCRQTFHNRAASRGAEIFHVLMAMRFDRAKATAAGAYKLLCRMAAAFKAEDHRAPPGRASWDDIERDKPRNDPLLATIVDDRAAGRPLLPCRQLGGLKGKLTAAKATRLHSNCN